MIFFEFYQNLPSQIDPIAFRIGFFPIGWYGLMYLLGFLIIYCLLRWRFKKERPVGFSWEKIENLLFWLMLGAICGGRLGYALFYNPVHFFFQPWDLISPFDAEGNFVGIYGMSYHGGLIGVIITGWIFTWKNKLNFWQLADFIVPAIPVGYFFGRIGNFLNGELYGRITQSRWGMNFWNPEVGAWELRFPSQFAEAFLEGLISFLILWKLKDKKFFSGQMLPLYLFVYGIFRFLVEFIREPDFSVGPALKIGGTFLTSGQIYSLATIGLAMGFSYYFRHLSGGKK